MKMKSLAALGMASLLAASLTYMAPAMADDIISNVGSGDGVITLANNDTNSAAVNDNSGMNNMQQNDPTAGSNAPADDTTVTPNNSDSSTSTNDTGTPDTATGDDDY